VSFSGFIVSKCFFK